MKIGIDARLWSETGVGRYIRNLVWQLQELDKTNQYVLFVNSKDYDSIKYQVSSIKYRNWEIIQTDIHWHTLEEQLALPSLLNKANLDLMHFPYFSVPIFYNRPFIVTIHDLINNHYPTGKASTLPLHLYYVKQLGYQFVIQQAAKKARKILTVSNATKNEIVDHLHIDPRKIIVTYEGIDEKILSLRAKRSNLIGIATAFSRPRNDSYFLYVGNAYPHKNVEMLLEAFTVFLRHPAGLGPESQGILKRVQDDTKLIFVGKEDYFYQRLKDKVQRLGLDTKIVFTGYITDEALSGYYQHAIATIVPSLMEGFGLPALEAMANGCPVIASDIPSLREVCENAAVYADPLDAKRFVEQMNSLFTNPHLRSGMIKRGKEQIKNFSWKRLAEQTLRVYNAL